MYAIVNINGDQVKVEKDSTVLVNRLKDIDSRTFKVQEVLFAKKGNSYMVGDPVVKDSYVEFEVVGPRRGKKVIAFKYRDRKSSQSKKGHRQDLTEIKVVDIKLGSDSGKTASGKKSS